MENHRQKISGDAFDLSSTMARFSLRESDRGMVLARLFEKMRAMLERHGLATSENLSQARAHLSPLELIAALEDLERARIFNQQNLSDILQHPEPRLFAYALTRMQQAGCLNALTRAYLLREQRGRDLDKLPSLLSYLAEAGLLETQIIERVIHHPQSSNLAHLLLVLNRCGLYHENNFVRLLGIPDLVDLEAGINGFVQLDILTQDYFDLLVQHPYPNRLSAWIFLLHEASILTPENLARLTSQPQHLLELSDPENETLVELVFGSQRPLTQELFLTMLDVASQEHSVESMMRLLNAIDDAAIEAPRTGLGR